jgi:hypothetical protein
MAISHGARRRRLPWLNAERLLIVVGAIGVLAAVVVTLLNWQGA